LDWSIFVKPGVSVVVSGDIRFCGVYGISMDFRGVSWGLMGGLWDVMGVSWGFYGILWDILYPLAITNSLRTGSHGPFSSMIKMMIYL
jgi:hypothetical protein